MTQHDSLRRARCSTRVHDVATHAGSLLFEPLKDGLSANLLTKLHKLIPAVDLDGRVEVADVGCLRGDTLVKQDGSLDSLLSQCLGIAQELLFERLVSIAYDDFALSVLRLKKTNFGRVGQVDVTRDAISERRPNQCSEMLG